MIVTASNNSWVSTGGDNDDDCGCSANDSSCHDECEICNGSNYIADCADGSCVIDTDADGKAMDCGGNCCDGDCDESDALYQLYYADDDGDGFGREAQGWMCSASADPDWVTNQEDIDDDCDCDENDETCFDLCDQCTGDNLTDDVCVEDCSGECVPMGTDGSYICRGGSKQGQECITEEDCPGIGNGTAFLDACNICSSGNTLYVPNIVIEYCNDNLYNDEATCTSASEEWIAEKSGPDIGCDGVCNSGYGYNNCGYCVEDPSLQGLTDSEGNCIYVVYPGDTNMDGKVDEDDIYSVVNNWDAEIRSRTLTDIDGNIISSNYDWIAQSYPINEVSECVVYADANGDGKINIKDITTIYKNLGSFHGFSTDTNCSSLPRESDLDIYYSIFQSLPYGELKIALSERFGFELLPQSFSVYPSYPNPFNPVSTIQYDVPVSGNITIKIINLYGQSMTEFRKASVEPGYYSYTWNGSDYSSGIYFCNIFFNKTLINSQKMILLK
jgi:hypothetical protein